MRVRKKKRKLVSSALCKTSNRSSLARIVDVRVVGLSGQLASHVASHMVHISPHYLHPSFNWQVMHRCFGPSSSYVINGRHSSVLVMMVEEIEARTLARRHREAQH